MPSTSARPTSARRAAELGVAGAYVAMAVALTWPLAAHLGTTVPNDLGDPLLNVWILWWNAVKVPFTSAWWNAPAYYPADGVLTFSEHLLGLSPISTPIYWLTGNIQLGYNVVLLSSFPLSAYFAYLLCRDLTGRRDAAFVGGLVFGFTPYRIVQLPHIQVLCSYWMPIALLGLHRSLGDRRARWLVLFGAGWLMQALCNGYYMVFLSVLIGCWLLWFVPWRDWRTFARIGAAWAIAALPVVPIVLKYRAVHAFLGLRRSIGEIASFSADMTSWLDHSGRLLLWTFTAPFHRPESELFPGLTVLLLTVAGLWVSRRRATASPPDPWVRALRRLLGVAGMIFAVGAVVAIVAPVEWKIGAVTISDTRLAKPLTWTATCGVALLATSTRVRQAGRGRTVLGFYLLAAVMMWLLALGPRPTFMGLQALYGGPYGWLMHLPGIDTLRVPARFHMTTVLCLACTAAVGFARVTLHLPRLQRRVLLAVVTLAVLGDTWIGGCPILAAPAPWAVEQREAPGPVLVLPLGGLGNDVEAMYRSMWTGNPVVNGYSGYAPPWYNAIDTGLASHDRSLLDELSARGVRQVVVDSSAGSGAAWMTYFSAHSEFTLMGADGVHRLYRMPAASLAADRAFGPAVPIAGVAANVHSDELPRLTDGDLTTRWETGPQLGIEVLTIDLGVPTRIAALETDLGPFVMDSPRELVIEASNDGTAWAEVWRGGGAGAAFRAAFKDPIRAPATFDVGDRTTRFLRLRELASDPTYYWSIAELRVLAPADR